MCSLLPSPGFDVRQLHMPSLVNKLLGCLVAAFLAGLSNVLAALKSQL